MLSIFVPARRSQSPTHNERFERICDLEERAAQSDSYFKKLKNALQDVAAHKLRADINQAAALAFRMIRPQPAQRARPFDGAEELQASHLVDPDQPNPLQQLIDDCKAAGINVAGAEMFLHAHQYHTEMQLGLLQRMEKEAIKGQRRGYRVDE